MEYMVYVEPGIAQLIELTQLRTAGMVPVPLACLPKLRDLTVEFVEDGLCLSGVAELTRLHITGLSVNFCIFIIGNA